MKLAWVVDSASGIDASFAREHNVHVLPLQVAFDGRNYNDGQDITEEEFFRQLESGAIPTSSQPSLGTCISLYKQLQSEGYDCIISLHVSGSLSGTVNTAKLAAEAVTIPVEVIDSGLIAKPMVFILQEGLRVYRNAFSGLQDIVAAMCRIRHETVGYFIVNDLGFLHRGGRLSATSALMASLLQIKPILQFKYQQFDVVAKVRTARKAKEFLYSLLEQDIKEKGVREISVVHASYLNEAESWMNQLREKFQGIPVGLSTLGTAVGAHSGPKAIGMAWVYNQPS